MAEVPRSLPTPKADENVFAIMRYPSAVNGTESIENLIPITSRASLFQKRHFFRNLAIFLLILLLLLIILLIGLAVYYNHLSKNNFGICTSDECLRTAASLKYSMDMSIDPCDDFYKYTCGFWSEEYPNHGWYPTFSNFETIDERISIAALKFLTTNASKDEPKPVNYTRQFYKSCMDVESIDNLRYTVIYKYLKEVNLPLVPSFFNKSLSSKFTFDWLKSEVALKKVFAMDTFLQLSVDSDIYHRNNNVIYLGTPASRSPLPRPINLKSKLPIRMKNEMDDDSEEEYEEQYNLMYKNVMKEVMRVVISNITKSPGDAKLEEAVNLIWNMSLDIYKIANDTSDNFEFLRLTVDEIQRTTNKFLESNKEKPQKIWREYVNAMFEGIAKVNLSLDKEDLILITPHELTYLGEILLYLRHTPDALIELYMWWVAVEAMIINTTSEIIGFIYKETAPFNEDPTIRSRSLICARLVTDFMGIAVSYGIADKTFLNQTQPKVEQMLNDIKTAFVERVNTIPWMDKATKKETLEKSKEMISFIGFPEWLLDKKSVEEYYGNITMKPDTYLENLMTIVKLYTPSTLSSLRVPNERKWRTDPTIVNAFNYFGDNSINVPMAILSFPMYHLGLEVLNYGALGSILGHELTHGFDNTGRKFDKYGNQRQWWSNETIETFERNTQCFIKQYDNFTLPNVKINVRGMKTLGENLADNGGLHHAFSAYKNFKRKNIAEQQLPGFENFSGSQLFFIAYGNVWCESRSDESLQRQIESDDHCPNRVRVLGTLQNSHEFAEAFKCPEGSRMNPKRERCRIW